MERFLRYGLEKGRKIRVMALLGGVLVQKPVTVLALDGETVTLRLSPKSQPVTLPLADILSCDYARGDHGED
jgi:hypothetical protein